MVAEEVPENQAISYWNQSEVSFLVIQAYSLLPQQQRELSEVLEKHRAFPLASRSDRLLENTMETKPGKIVQEPLHPLPWKMWEPIQKKIESML